jgi:ATP-dependent RNA helicase SUPV3L1/SUV3
VPKLQVLDLYVWLSFRLDESFPDHELASSQKALCSMWVFLSLCDILICPILSLNYVLTILFYRLIEEFLDRYGWQKPMAGRLPVRKMSSSLLSETARPHL